MPVELSWPAVICLGTAAVTAAVAGLAWRRRERTGALLWFATVAAISVWAGSYGLGLLVFDPAVRPLLDIPMWLGATLSVPLLLAFALEYTGRGRLVRSWWLRGLILSWLGVWVLYATNPLHHLMWTDYHIAPVFGAATVEYTPGVGLFAAHAYAYVVLTLASLLLLDAVVSYGSLFRVQGLAILVGVLLPTAANVAWLFDLGPVGALNLTPVAFGATAIAGMYAFFSREMFELSPAVRRIGEQAAIDDLPTPVAVVDIRGRLISLNDAATALFGVDSADALTRPLSALTDADIDFAASEQSLTQSVGNRPRDFEVAVAPIDDAADRHIGYTIVLTDVTAERQRRQRLEVLNRILRHNLRNDLTVVVGNAEIIEARASDPVAGHATTITDHAGSLLSTSEKARDAAQALGDASAERIDLRDLLSSLGEADVERIEWDVPPTLLVRSNRTVLALVVENVLQNALTHGCPTADATVRITAATTDDGCSLSIIDDGPGIPDHELAPLNSETETPLEHTSGLGLWLVHWGVRRLGGSVTFDTGDAGTTVTIAIPDWEESVTL